jgi:AmmeMemoRadiSam system protein B
LTETEFTMPHELIRPCAACGTFYAGDPAGLRKQVDDLLGASGCKPTSEFGGGILGIVAPHAGYVYSGGTAACVYGALAGSGYRTVVIVAPSHRDRFTGVSAYIGDGYVTPLGVVPVDRELRTLLAAEPSPVVVSAAGHGNEHAVEVHLPFLQRVLGEFSFVPLVMGDQEPATCFALGETLGRVLKGRKVLLVASTDLSHFFPRHVAQGLDTVVMDNLRKFDAEALMADLEKGKCEACGGGPTVAVMTALKLLGARTMRVAQYTTSGDVTGEDKSVVGYVSAAAI